MDDDEEGDRLQLLRQGVIAFERLRLQENTGRLADALETNAEQLLPLLGDHDQLEAALYLDIIRGRLQIIRNFNGLVNDDERERVLQEYLFDHLWLIDPSWERAAGSELMEQRVASEFLEIDAELDPAELAGRIDIKYRTSAQKHVIVELKRASVRPSILALVQQGVKYRSATRKCLAAAQKADQPIEIVFVIGRRGLVEDDQDLIRHQLKSVQGRIVTFDSLIEGAMASYGDYLSARGALDSLSRLFDAA